jgi:hypothetical protein
LINSIIVEIRAIPGYEQFLTDATFGEIAQATRLGIPLVYLSTTPVGSFALIVHRHSHQSQPIVVPVKLDTFTQCELNILLFGQANVVKQSSWMSAYAQQDTNRQQWLETIQEVTRQLWDALVGPVVQQLLRMKVEQAVLIPTGLLALLPLHAA